MKIKWQLVKGYQYYEVSSDGQIRGLDRPKWNGKVNYTYPARDLRLYDNGHGYLFVYLYGKENKRFYVHRLVADCFIPNPKHLPQVNHKNSNKQDNRVNNLEWCSELDNKQHSSRNGLVASGERHGLTTLTWKEVNKIRGEYILGINGYIKLGEKYKTSPATIRRIVKNESWNK